MKIINMIPENKEFVTPKEYLKIVEKNPEDIKSTKIIPPQLGERGFGQILITRKSPVFRKKIAI